MAGKPYPAIYDLCLAEAQRLLGRARGRALCIGDGIPTDVKGAQAHDLDCLFISGGIHGAEAGTPEAVGELLARQGVTATFSMPALSW